MTYTQLPSWYQHEHIVVANPASALWSGMSHTVETGILIAALEAVVALVVLAGTAAARVHSRRRFQASAQHAPGAAQTSY